MVELTKREDQIMQIVWNLKTAFIREIVEALPEPKPHYNTEATLVKILVKKEIIEKTKLEISRKSFSIIHFQSYLLTLQRRKS